MGGSVILYILLAGVLGYLIYEKWERKGLIIFAGAVAASVGCALLGWREVVMWITIAAVVMLVLLFFNLAGVSDSTKKGCLIVLALFIVSSIIFMALFIRSFGSIVDALFKH